MFIQKKRQNRVETMLSQRMLGLLKPVAIVDNPNRVNPSSSSQQTSKTSKRAKVVKLGISKAS